MTKPKGLYRYTNEKGEELNRRANFSTLKLTLLKALREMDKNNERPTAYDKTYTERFYDVVAIARFIYGEAVFKDGKLKTSTRTSLNNSLRGMMWDGYITYTGLKINPSMSMREHVKNNWRITGEGLKVLVADYNGYLKAHMEQTRYVGRSGDYPVTAIKKKLYSDYWGD